MGQDLGNVVVPDAIVDRRNLKKQKTYEYDVKWQFKPLESNTWVERDTLIMMGFLKLVQREDEKQAAAAGLQTKQLTQPGVEKHLADFGVDAESASHTQINQLSGGMKVKVVLAAAMWQNPHILILDEPTNYLDREGLGALVLAIKDYCDGVAQEKWIMKGGHLRIEGESKADEAEEEISGNKVQEDIVDASGNKIEQNAVDNSSDKDKKRKLDGLKKKTLSDEEKWALEDQIVELKEKLEAKKA